MFCKNCGKEINDDAIICVHCGCAIKNQPLVDLDASEKSKTTAILLCAFLGGLGVHRYYVGKIGTGVLMTLTVGCCGILTLVDFIMLLMGTFTDSEGKKLTV